MEDVGSSAFPCVSAFHAAAQWQYITGIDVVKLPLALILAASPAVADPITIPCAPRAALVARLANGWSESGQFQGINDTGDAIWEVYARPDGTWTLFVVRPDGMACAVAAGPTWIGFGVPQGEEG